MAYIKDDLNEVSFTPTVENLEDRFGPGYEIRRGTTLEFIFGDALDDFLKFDHLKIYLIRPDGKLQRYKTLNPLDAYPKTTAFAGMYLKTDITSAYPVGNYVAVLSGNNRSNAKLQTRSNVFRIL